MRPATLLKKPTIDLFFGSIGCWKCWFLGKGVLVFGGEYGNMEVEETGAHWLRICFLVVDGRKAPDNRRYLCGYANVSHPRAHSLKHFFFFFENICEE